MKPKEAADLKAPVLPGDLKVDANSPIGAGSSLGNAKPQSIPVVVPHGGYAEDQCKGCKVGDIVILRGQENIGPVKFTAPAGCGANGISCFVKASPSEVSAATNGLVAGAGTPSGGSAGVGQGTTNSWEPGRTVATLPDIGLGASGTSGSPDRVLSTKTWGFYQPGEARPVTVFRLGEKIPSMPNVPDPSELPSSGNWYGQGGTPQANIGASGQGNVGGVNAGGGQGNGGGAPRSDQRSGNQPTQANNLRPGQPYTPGSKDDPNCLAGCYDVKVLNDLGIKRQYPDGTPAPTSAPEPLTMQQLQGQVAANTQKQLWANRATQQAYGQSINDPSIEPIGGRDVGVIGTLGACAGPCIGLVGSVGLHSGVTLYKIDPQQSVGYGNLSGLAYAGDARGVAGGDSATVGGFSKNSAGVAIPITPVTPSAAVTYATPIMSISP